MDELEVRVRAATEELEQAKKTRDRTEIKFCQEELDDALKELYARRDNEKAGAS
jgi:hypothetical protein